MKLCKHPLHCAACTHLQGKPFLPSQWSRLQMIWPRWLTPSARHGSSWPVHRAAARMRLLRQRTCRTECSPRSRTALQDPGVRTSHKFGAGPVTILIPRNPDANPDATT